MSPRARRKSQRGQRWPGPPRGPGPKSHWITVRGVEGTGPLYSRGVLLARLPELHTLRLRRVPLVDFLDQVAIALLDHRTLDLQRGREFARDDGELPRQQR